MFIVEIYINEDKLLKNLSFSAMPRIGEIISILEDDYFTYYNVKKVWYRAENNKYCIPCVEVVLDD